MGTVGSKLTLGPSSTKTRNKGFLGFFSKKENKKLS